jgi:hypothetical protein
MGVALGQDNDEVARGDDVGGRGKVMAVDGMGTIFLEGGEW